MLDFNNASTQTEFDLIPDETVAPVRVTVRPGNAGTGGWETRSKSGDSTYLNCEFVVLDGPYAKRKFWTNLTVTGNTDGQQKAVDISRSKIRGMLESARGISPADESEAAMTARRISTWGDVDGLSFVAKIGIQKGKDGYKDSNTLIAAITPDKQQWVKLEQRRGASQSAPAHVAAQAAPSAAGRPAWA